MDADRVAELKAKIPELIAARDAAATKRERKALAQRVRLLRSVVSWAEGRG